MNDSMARLGLVAGPAGLVFFVIAVVITLTGAKTADTHVEEMSWFVDGDLVQHRLTNRVGIVVDTDEYDGKTRCKVKVHLGGSYFNEEWINEFELVGPIDEDLHPNVISSEFRLGQTVKIRDTDQIGTIDQIAYSANGVDYRLALLGWWSQKSLAKVQ